MAGRLHKCETIDRKPASGISSAGKGASLDIAPSGPLPQNVPAFSCERQREADGRPAALVSCNALLGGCEDNVQVASPSLEPPATIRHFGSGRALKRLQDSLKDFHEQLTVIHTDALEFHHQFRKYLRICRRVRYDSIKIGGGKAIAQLHA